MMHLHTPIALVNSRLTRLSEMQQSGATLRLKNTYNILPPLIARGGAQFCNQTTMLMCSTSLVQSGKYGIQHWCRTALKPMQLNPSSFQRRRLSQKSNSPAIILAKAEIHLAVDSLFRRNGGNSQGFKPFSTPLKSGMCGEKWIPAFARMTLGGCVWVLTLFNSSLVN